MHSFLSLLAALPKGDALDEPAWAVRHRGILHILWLHVLGVPLYGAYMGAGQGLYLGGGALLGTTAIGARLPVVGRRIQAAIATYGLVIASALLVHLGRTNRAAFSFLRHDVRDPAVPGLAPVFGGPAVHRHRSWDHRHQLSEQGLRPQRRTGAPMDLGIGSQQLHSGSMRGPALFLRVNELSREEALQSEARTRMIIETGLDAVVTTNTSGIITDWNTQAE